MDQNEKPAETQPLQAALLTRGTAIAVDLCVTVASGSCGFALISLLTPLDNESAKIPIMLVMFVALSYLVWGRNWIFSPGRKLFGLRLHYPPGRYPGSRGRPIAVHIDPDAPKDTEGTGAAIGVIAGATLIAGLGLAQAVASTSVFVLVQQHAVTHPPLQATYGVRATLSALPRSLLIGKTRAYVQVGADWGPQYGVLNYYLKRSGAEPWQVIKVSAGTPGKFADYALAAPDTGIPVPAQ